MVISFDSVGEQVHPSCCVSRNGELIRNPFLDAPSGDPLLEVDVTARACFVLLASGEDPASVGIRLLAESPETAGVRAILTARRVRRVTRSTLDGRGRAAKLKSLVPQETARWALLLTASNAFPDVTEMARLLQTHRSSIYRTLERTTALLRHHAAQPIAPAD